MRLFLWFSNTVHIWKWRFVIMEKLNFQLLEGVFQFVLCRNIILHTTVVSHFWGESLYYFTIREWPNYSPFPSFCPQTIRETEKSNFFLKKKKNCAKIEFNSWIIHPKTYQIIEFSRQKSRFWPKIGLTKHWKNPMLTNFHFSLF